VGSFDAIRDVTETLRDMLRAGFAQAPVINAECEANDLTTTIAIPPPRPLLTVTLYDVVEDPGARNRPNEREYIPGPPARVVVRRPPASLLLRYLLAPWSGDPLSDQRVLGRAVQTLYDNAVIGGPDLRGSLFGRDESVQVTMAPLSLEDRTHVWRSMNSNYRLSVNYEVRVVHIETRKELASAAPVRRRSLDHATRSETP
jgi:Pvc16 N-terminal domain